MNDETINNIEKEKEDNIFKYSPFPIMNINPQGKVVKINKSFHEFFGFTIEDLNSQSLDVNVRTFNSYDPKVKGFVDALNKVFNHEIIYNDSKTGVISKNKEYKWVSCHIRLINDDLAQVSFQDLSELKQSKQEALDLSKYLEGIEEASKTAFYIRDNNQFKWTKEIFNILELDSEDYDENIHENILRKYMPAEAIINIDRALNQLSKNEPINLEHELKTAKGNTKFIRAYIKLQKSGKHYVEIGFIQDITHEKLAQKEALELETNIKEIQGFSKIFIGTLENGEYSFTPEIYNILEVNPEDATPEELLNYIFPEDLKKILESFNNVTPKNPTFNLIYKVKTSNGEIKYISSYNKATFSYTGELQKIIAFEQDITEQIVANQIIKLTKYHILNSRINKNLFRRI